MQQSAAAADMGGIAPEPTVQEAGPAGQFEVPPGISMREFKNVDSMLAACVQPNGTQNSGTKIGPTNLPWPEENPSLTQLRAAATTAGFAPKPVVQEAGTGPNITRPGISMREFMDVDSMLAAHDAVHGYAPELMQVFSPSSQVPPCPVV